MLPIPGQSALNNQTLAGITKGGGGPLLIRGVDSSTERQARAARRILEKPREREADEKNGGLASEFGKGGEGGEQGAREDGGTKIASFVRPRINNRAPTTASPNFINRRV